MKKQRCVYCGEKIFSWFSQISINVNLKEKIIKIISVIIFFVFHILSCFTSNFPYPEYAEHLLVSFIFSLLTIISFLYITTLFSKSKKFFIILSIYFLIILSVMTFAIVTGGLTSIPLIILAMSFGIPIEHFTDVIINLLEFFNIHIPNDYAFFAIFTLIILLFYGTYFISNKYRKDENKWRRD